MGGASKFNTSRFPKVLLVNTKWKAASKQRAAFQLMETCLLLLVSQPLTSQWWWKSISKWNASWMDMFWNPQEVKFGSWILFRKIKIQLIFPYDLVTVLFGGFGGPSAEASVISKVASHSSISQSNLKPPWEGSNYLPPQTPTPAASQQQEWRMDSSGDASGAPSSSDPKTPAHKSSPSPWASLNLARQPTAAATAAICRLLRALDRPLI